MLVRHNTAALAGLGPSTSYARTQVAGDEEDDEHEAVHHAAASAGPHSLPAPPAMLSFTARYPQQQGSLAQFRPMMRHNFHPQLPTPPTLPLPPHGPHQADEDQLEDDDGLYSDEDATQPASKSPRQPAKRKVGAGGAGGARGKRTPAGRKRTATPDDDEESERGSDDQDDGSDGSARRPLKRARLNAPEPIPNLTKKSRGRRVPRADDAEATNEYSARKYICPVPECSKFFPPVLARLKDSWHPAGKGFSRGEHLKVRGGRVTAQAVSRSSDSLSLSRSGIRVRFTLTTDHSPAPSKAAAARLPGTTTSFNINALMLRLFWFPSHPLLEMSPYLIPYSICLPYPRPAPLPCSLPFPFPCFYFAVSPFPICAY